jgi:Fe-S-cluster containining protein
MARLPVKSDSEHAAALAAWSCPYLSDRGCEVYSERPLICRLFGTTPRLACPNGRRPAEMIAPDVEQDIFRYFKDVRHVLV